MPATGNVLLDTSVVIPYLKGDASIRQQIQALPVLYLPMTVVGELYCGAYASRHHARVLQEIRSFFDSVVMLGQSEKTAECYGRIRAELAKAGTPIPENDIWIAALAREQAMSLVTRDAHFERISGLDVLKW
jgi:tRNA(fMet)-specific endonuclease VapC